MHKNHSDHESTTMSMDEWGYIPDKRATTFQTDVGGMSGGCGCVFSKACFECMVCLVGCEVSLIRLVDDVGMV